MLNPVMSIAASFEQPQNILFISVTLEVSNFVKSRDVMLEQLVNILAIVVTLAVFQLLTLRLVTFQQE